MNKEINLDQYKIDYNNCMLAEDMMKKYSINYYFFKKLKKKLKLDRGGKIGKLEYILKKNNIAEEPEIIEEPTKPTKPIKPIKPIKHTKSILKANTEKNKKGAKVNINIKSINTDGETPEYEIKKCDTTYNNDKSKLLDVLK